MRSFWSEAELMPALLQRPDSGRKSGLVLFGRETRGSAYFGLRGWLCRLECVFVFIFSGNFSGSFAAWPLSATSSHFGLVTLNCSSSLPSCLHYFPRPPSFWFFKVLVILQVMAMHKVSIFSSLHLDLWPHEHVLQDTGQCMLSERAFCVETIESVSGACIQKWRQTKMLPFHWQSMIRAVYNTE